MTAHLCGADHASVVEADVRVVGADGQEVGLQLVDRYALGLHIAPQVVAQVHQDVARLRGALVGRPVVKLPARQVRGSRDYSLE